MVFAEGWKRKIALLMVLVLLFTPVLHISAEELPEPTEEVLQMEVPVETDPTEAAETMKETEPQEETQVTEATEVPEETEIPEETQVSEEPEPTEETFPEEVAVWSSRPAVLTVAEVLTKSSGEETLLLEGTVVFASQRQAVLQDDTGGIRLAFGSVPEIELGDILLVTGHRSSGGFIVTEFEKTGTGELPAREATLVEGKTALRILVKGAVLGYNTLTQNSYSSQMVGEVPSGITVGNRVDAWGVMLDGIFYVDTMRLSESQQPEAPEPEEEPDSDWNFYFGQLHAHTDISDGHGTVQEAFEFAAQVEKLDFFAVTDHSNSFDNAELAAIDLDGTAISEDWAAGKAAAEAVTNGNFVGIFGYEMTWPEDLAIGHISTFCTPGWQTRDQAGMNTLKGYLNTLASVPESVSQFNHPGAYYGDFRNFSEYSPQYDTRVHLLEVGGEGDFTAYDAYTTALDAGWHLAPSNNQNNHNGNWGCDSDARTVILAKTLTEESIYDAIRNYRVYATEDADLQILYHLNNRIMGSTMPEAATLTAQVSITDGSGDPIGQVEVITEGGEVAASTTLEDSGGTCTLKIEKTGAYYYLRITRNGKIIAVTAPVWVDTYEDLGVSAFTTDAAKPVQGTGANLTLTLYNHENVPFAVEKVTFSLGNEVLQQIFAPGSVEPIGKLEIPLTYTQESPGMVTIIASVEGTIAGLTRSYQTSITLRFQAPEAQLQSIEKVRENSLGDVYRVRGYVTAGTANPYNTFDDTIYLQDDSGGIAVMDFADQGIQLGTPMEVQGILRSAGGNLVLAMTDYEILEEDYYRYVPTTMAHGQAMDYAEHGGQLLQIEGHVVSITNTPDLLGVSRFTIRDAMGDLATVMIEEDIGSGAYGTNELTTDVKTSRCVRAMGLLHIDEFGSSVLRVRNCDEVAYVPPRKDPSNPRTGDWFAWLLAQFQ